jgi:hypothetical protein
LKPSNNNSDNNKRNAFDDVLSYINHNADDLEFKKDLSQLLDSPLFNQESLTLQYQPQVHRQQNGCKAMFMNILSTGLKYIKFTIIMFLAILINIKRGQTSFLRSSNNPYNLKNYSYYPIIVHK